MKVESGDKRRVRFSRFELDLETSELWNDGERVELAPQPLKILAVLVSRAPRLVERSELRRQIWGDGWCDWEAGLHQAIHKIRQTLDDRAQAPSFIETVPRRGYRFVAPLQTVEDRPAVPAARLRPFPATVFAVLLLSCLWISPEDPSPKSGDGMAAGAFGKGTVRKTDSAARRLLREGRYLLTTGRVSEALVKLHQATVEDPGWAVPWSVIAEAELARPEPGRQVMARRAIEKALARDPEDGRAWLTLARLRLWQEWDWSGARQALRRAVSLDPDEPDVWQLIASLETVQGRLGQAELAARRAMQLDPVSTALRADLGWVLYYSGALQEALGECQRSLELEPRNPRALQCTVQTLLALGRRGDAATIIARSTGLGTTPGPTDVSSILTAYSRLQLEAIDGQEACASPAASALPRVVSGDLSGALDALLAGARQGSGWEVPFSRFDPLFAPLRGDARFAKLESFLRLPKLADLEDWPHP